MQVTQEGDPEVSGSNTFEANTQANVWVHDDGWGMVDQNVDCAVCTSDMKVKTSCQDVNPKAHKIDVEFAEQAEKANDLTVEMCGQGSPSRTCSVS